MSNAIEVGTKLVALCNQGKAPEAVEQLYDEKIVSIEARGSEQMPARMEGIQAILGKHEWWYANHEVHSDSAVGPFCGHREDQFAVFFETELTPKGGERHSMREVALYTVSNGKIVQEEFLYLMA